MAEIKKVSYSHDAMIDLLIASPMLNQGEVARYFGYTEAWMSQIVSSDVFKERLAERKGELTDPVVIRSLNERFEAIARRSMDRLMEKIEANSVSEKGLIDMLGVTSKAMGFGARGPQVQVNTQYVVQLPAKAESADAWERANRPQAIEVGK